MLENISNYFRKNFNSKVDSLKEFWNASTKEKLLVLLNNALLGVILGLILFIIISDSSFLSMGNFINILSQSSVKLILALGVGGIIILQGTDLSLGRIVGLTAIVAASFLQRIGAVGNYYESLPGWLVDNDILFILTPLIIVMIVGAFFSAINGIIVAYFKVHPFLATLGSAVALYGILQIYFSSGDNGAQPIGSLSDRYTDVVIRKVSLFGYDFPILIFYAVIVTMVMWVIWNKTTFGKNMYAVGGNPEAAKISGVSVIKTTVLVYILAGALYGIGGFLEVARIGSAGSAIGNGYELDAIAACVVGGISFSGGIGKISGAVLGVFMFTIITYGMIYIGIDNNFQFIVKGVIIVFAVALDTRKYIQKT